MKKIFKTIAAALLTTLSLASCNSFLDTTPTDRISDRMAWTSYEYATMYVNNFYAYLDRYSPFGSLQFSGNLTEGLTPYLKYGSNQPGSKAGDSNDYVFYPDRITPDENLLGNWDDGYVKIRRINEFLSSQKAYSSFTDEQNTLLEAQARFFRAFVYFQLARRHGSLILYDDINFTKNKARSSEEETWNFIATDLDYAIENLPDDWDADNEGRITKLMAQAFKSRVMLYAQRWQDAADAATAVIDSGKYDLVSDYAQSWKGDNAESIIQYKYDKGNKLVHNFDQSYVPYGDYTAIGSDEYGGAAGPTQEMVEEYEDRNGNTVDWSPWHTGAVVSTRPPFERLEPRFAATILYNGCTWKGNVMDITEDGTHGRYMDYRADLYANGRTVTGYYLRKLLDEDNKTDFFSIGSSQTWVELRYAEVLLNRAEARYRLGDASGALSDVNLVRRRVNLPAKSGLSGENLFAAIRHERLVELSYEGHIYWDMRRWRLADKEWNDYRVHALEPVSSGSSYSFRYVDADLQDRKFLSRTYVFPVPTTETKNNSLCEQYDEWK